MINITSADTTSTNPSVDTPVAVRDRTILPLAQDGAAPAGRLLPRSSAKILSVAWRRFRGEIAKPAMLLFLSAHVALGLAFYLAPQIDIRVSKLFYISGRGFFIGSRASTVMLPFLPWITIIFVNLMLLLLVYKLFVWRRNRRSATHLLSIRRILFLLMTLMLGPGVLINVALKHHSGRSRPIRVETFGGYREFTAAFDTSGSCKSNCSFVSGEAAMGYYLLAFLFVTRKRRAALALAAYALGTAIGILRIAQGAHFLSDVVFAGFFTFLVAWILSMLMLPAQESLPLDARPGRAIR